MKALKKRATDFYMKSRKYHKKMLERRRIGEIYPYSEGYIRQKRLVLDLGCGSGAYTVSYTLLGLQCVGIDISPQATRLGLKLAKDRGLASSCFFVVGDAECLPFRCESFDLIVNYDTMEHLIYPIKCIKEMKRVAQQEGIILIRTVNHETLSITKVTKFDILNLFHFFACIKNYLKFLSKRSIDTKMLICNPGEINDDVVKDHAPTHESITKVCIDTFIPISYFLENACVELGLKIQKYSTYNFPYAIKTKQPLKKICVLILLFLNRIPILRHFGTSVFIACEKS